MQLAASPRVAARWPLAVAFLPPDEAFQEVPAVLSPPAEAFPAQAAAYQVQTAAYQEAAAVLSPPAEVFQAQAAASPERAVPLLPPVPPAHTAALQAAPAAVTPPAVPPVHPAVTSALLEAIAAAADLRATAVLQEVPPAVVIPPAVLQAAVTAAVRIHHIHRTLPVVRVLQAGIPEAVAEDINT